MIRMYKSKQQQLDEEEEERAAAMANRRNSQVAAEQRDPLARRKSKRKSKKRHDSSRDDRPWNAHRKERKEIFGLEKGDMDYLKKNTHYDEKTIKEWYRGFKAECPDGNLQKAKILEMYAMILPVGDSTAFVDQIFRIFDKDGNGSIDFREFMLATDMTTAGTPEEKLRWAFKLYDKDGSGNIDLAEMIEAIGTLYDMESCDADPEATMRKAKALFAAMDQDGDETLTADEFVAGCMADEELMAMLQPGLDPRDG